MKRQDIEFNIHSIVTFKPYNEGFEAVVIGLDVVLNKDERVFYKLELINNKLNIETSGKCILESKYYIEHKDNNNELLESYRAC